MTRTTAGRTPTEKLTAKLNSGREVGAGYGDTLTITDCLTTTCPVCERPVTPPCVCECGLALPMGTDPDWCRYTTAQNDSLYSVRESNRE